MCLVVLQQMSFIVIRFDIAFINAVRHINTYISCLYPSWGGYVYTCHVRVLVTEMN